MSQKKLNLIAKQVDDEKKYELWSMICSCYPDFDAYQKRQKGIFLFSIASLLKNMNGNQDD